MSSMYKGPIVLAVLDGVGLRAAAAGNAIKQARLDFLGSVVKKYPAVRLEAAGEAVGILPGMIGNSEVGHNALGSGQIIKQGVARIEEAFSSGSIWETPAWREAIKHAETGTLHFAGIFSDGGVHSDIKHLEKMVAHAHEQGIKHIRFHLVLDGRDVPPQSEPKYIKELEAFVNNFPDHPDYKIASGGGRMIFVADRYESDWSIVERGWKAMVEGRADHAFPSAEAAIEALRVEDPEVQDQYLPAFVIVDENGEPVGPVKEGDSFIYFDFRADRAVEIAQAFTYDEFPHFDRGTPGNRRPNIFFAGMTEYNSDTHVPEFQLVPPVQIYDTLNQVVGQNNLSQLAISETVKFGHITYYFNGNSYERAPREEHLEIASDTLPFNTRPWMKSAETTDALLERAADFDFIRINYPGGDMVGHFGEMASTIIALEAIDLQLSRIAKRVDELGGLLIITADHGNAEELQDESGAAKTAHTTNSVPCIFYDNTDNVGRYQVNQLPDAGLSNVAPTIATLLGIEKLPRSWRPSLVTLKS